MLNKKRKRNGKALKSSKRRRKEHQNEISWNSKKPAYIATLKQQSIQIKNYLEGNRDFKAKDVLNQIRKQKPDPWPEANLSDLTKLIRQLKVENTVVWDTNKPGGRFS